MAIIVGLNQRKTEKSGRGKGAGIEKLGWRDSIALGVTPGGELEIVTSGMSGERALWLLEWAKRWVMGLDRSDVGGPSQGDVA